MDVPDGSPARGRRFARGLTLGALAVAATLVASTAGASAAPKLQVGVGRADITPPTGDLGLEVLWQVDSDGLYRAHWEPPYDQRLDTYRFRITANRYGLTSRRFHLTPSRTLTPSRIDAPSGSVAVELRYPKPRVREDVGDPPPDSTASLTARPGHVHTGAGRVTFVVDGDRRTVTAGPDGRFQVRARSGATVSIPAGAARDRFGNFNVRPLVFRAPPS